MCALSPVCYLYHAVPCLLSVPCCPLLVISTMLPPVSYFYHAVPCLLSTLLSPVCYLYHAVPCLLSVPCCPLSVICTMLSPVCYLYHAVPCQLSVPCCPLSVICTMLSPVCYLYHAVPCLLSVPCCPLSVISTMLSPVCYLYHAVPCLLSLPCCPLSGNRFPPVHLHVIHTSPLSVMSSPWRRYTPRHPINVCRLTGRKFLGEGRGRQWRVVGVHIFPGHSCDRNIVSLVAVQSGALRCEVSARTRVPWSVLGLGSHGQC